MVSLPDKHPHSVCVTEGLCSKMRGRMHTTIQHEFHLSVLFSDRKNRCDDTLCDAKPKVKLRNDGDVIFRTVTQPCRTTGFTVLFE